MSKTRPIVPVNFDNDEELLNYVNGKGNRAEFIRYCIRKEMMDEKKTIGSGKDLDNRIEKIMRKCLADMQPLTPNRGACDPQGDESIMEAASFFDED